MIKKIALLIISLFIFVSCWDDSSTSWSSSAWLIKYSWDKYSISIPESWEVIKDKENIIPKPNAWEISLVATAIDRTDWFSNNILVLESSLDNITTSKEYSMLNNIWAETDYLNYNKLDSKEFEFLDGEKSMLYTFEAKYNLDTPKLKFIQTAYICNWNNAYFFTIALSPLIRDTSKYEAFLKTFTCVK